IAATLLVLELHVPDASHGLGEALLAQWPAYVAYVTSFLTIGIIWVNHHALFQHIHHVDRSFLFNNLFLLMVVSITPFPTAVLGRHATADQDSHLAAALYGAEMFVMGIAFMLRGGRLKVNASGPAARVRCFQPASSCTWSRLASRSSRRRWQC